MIYLVRYEINQLFLKYPTLLANVFVLVEVLKSFCIGRGQRFSNFLVYRFV